MLCGVAAHPFQAHANYGTWLIDFGSSYKIGQVIGSYPLSISYSLLLNLKLIVSEVSQVEGNVTFNSMLC